MKKIKLSIKSKDYNITLEDDFLPFFEKEFERVFQGKKNLSEEDLLRAFVQFAYENYKSEELHNSLINNINMTVLSKN
ncbi:MAG: hypothetical protein ACK5LP_04145 [Campylobacteraceae bacterium]